MSGKEIKLSHIMKFFIFVVFFYSLLNFCNNASTERKEVKEEGKEVRTMEIKSSAFKNGERIPKKYTCEGEDFSPPLEWSGAPAGTKSFVIIVDDPDAPIGTFNHWVIYDIPSSYSSLRENLPKTPELEDKIKQGMNDFGRIGWGGPCPPKGHGTHRYFFKIMALSVESIGLKPGAKKSEVLKAIEGKIIASAQFYGTYSR